MARLMLVLAHPDDESFVGGGTLAHYAAQGHPTALLCLTDGQAGRTGVSGRPPLAMRETLGALRRAELMAAARVLGIAEAMTPGWQDGALQEVSDDRGIGEVVAAIRIFRPDVLISFGPEGGPSGHADHVASWRWAHAAFDAAADPAYASGGEPHATAKLYWIAWPPEVDSFRGIAATVTTAVVGLGPEIEARKRAAFAEHASQQDHAEIYAHMMALLRQEEAYHLAKSRLPLAPQRETCLLTGLP